MGDVLTSMVRPINDLGHLGCYLFTEINGLAASSPVGGVANMTAFEEGDKCTRYNPWLDFVMVSLPFVIRLVQCLRRHIESVRNHKQGFFHSPTQLYNACKYASCLAVSVCSYLDHAQVERAAAEHRLPSGYASWGDVPIGDSQRMWHTLWLLMVLLSTSFKLYWDIVSAPCSVLFRGMLFD
jgi:hypothetical protein|eukprot:COSAG01_NODE_8861_length_2633_cov_36.395422_1_plen_182_part_00